MKMNVRNHNKIVYNYTSPYQSEIESELYTPYCSNGRLKFFKIFMVCQHATKRSLQFMPYSAPFYIARYTQPKLLAATPGRNITHTPSLLKPLFAFNLQTFLSHFPKGFCFI